MMKGMASMRVEIKVRGLVQGVFFRQGAKRIAEELGVTGWVRNEDDGSVRVVAEGEEERLQKLVEWCKKGTEWSRIDRVEVEWRDATGEFSGFEVR